MTPLEAHYLETLRRTQWLPSEKLAAYHANLLGDISRHAHANVPAYRDRLAPVFAGGQFDAARWSDVPILGRGEIEADPEHFHAANVPEHLASHTTGRTSGTTGTRLDFLQSALAGTASRCQVERTFEVHGIDRNAHRASIRGSYDEPAPYPEGRETAGWNLTSATARSSRIDIDVPIDKQAEWLVRVAPRYLQTYPSTAVAIARHIAAAGASLKLWGVLTVGESLTPDMREEIRTVFGCATVDNYGATEIGYLAFQCPAGDGYHIADESVHLEVVDENGAPLPAGQPGRVVVTSLYNFAMPFIRYAIGDFAIAAEGPCGCGRTLPRLQEILGRARSIFTFPDGTQQSPWVWRGIFRDLVPARQLQIIQTAVDKIELRYITNGGPPPDPVKVESVGRQKIHRDILVRAVEVDEIPRSASGKIEDCISLVSAR